MNKEGVTPSKYGVKKRMASEANSPNYGGKVKMTSPNITKLAKPGLSKNSLQGYGDRCDKRHSGAGPNWNDRRPKAVETPYKGPPSPKMPTKVKPAECAKSYQGKPIE